MNSLNRNTAILAVITLISAFANRAQAATAFDNLAAYSEAPQVKKFLDAWAKCGPKGNTCLDQKTADDAAKLRELADPDCWKTFGPIDTDKVNPCKEAVAKSPKTFSVKAGGTVKPNDSEAKRLADAKKAADEAEARKAADAKRAADEAEAKRLADANILLSPVKTEAACDKAKIQARNACMLNHVDRDEQDECNKLVSTAWQVCKGNFVVLNWADAKEPIAPPSNVPGWLSLLLTLAVIATLAIERIKKLKTEQKPLEEKTAPTLPDTEKFVTRDELKTTLSSFLEVEVEQSILNRWITSSAIQLAAEEQKLASLRNTSPRDEEAIKQAELYVENLKFLKGEAEALQEQLLSALKDKAKK